MLHLRSSPSASLQVAHSTTISVKTAIVRVLLKNCAGQQCRPHGAQDGFSTAWGRRSTNQFEGNGSTHRARSAQRSNMFQLIQCSTIFTFLARSSHWNHLQCNLNCDSILYLTSRLSSPGRTVYECATKGQILQTGSIKTVGKYKRPEMARSRVEQQRRRGSRVLLGHYATNSKAFLVLSSLPSKVYSSGAQLSACSRPFNEHFVAAYIKLCLL